MICRKSAPCLSDLPVFLAKSELFYSDLMHFSGSQSKGSQKNGERQLDRTKNTPREKSQGVFGVHYYLLAGYARSAMQPAASRPSEHAARVVAAPVGTRGTRGRWPVRARSAMQPAASRRASQYERLPQANQAGRCYS